MGGLELLAALNWGMAVLYGAVIVFLAMVAPLEAALIGGSLLALVAAPHAYLGMSIEKGRGRTLQTILAVLSLFNFPLGTAFGVFALITVWSDSNKHLFEEGGYASSLEPMEDELEEPGEADESPYAYAKRLQARGLRAGAIRLRLEQRDLPDDEIETLLGALGLSTQARTPARRPVPRSTGGDDEVTKKKPAPRRPAPKRPAR